MAAGRVDVPRRGVIKFSDGSFAKGSRCRDSVSCRFAADVPDLGSGRRGKRELLEKDGVRLPDQKKRKFSPIIWDAEAKEALLKTKPTTGSAVVQSPLSDSCVDVDGMVSSGVSDNSVSVEQDEGLEAPSDRSDVYVGHVGGDELEEGEVEDEGIQTRDVLKSRWLSESPEDTYASDDDYVRGGDRQSHSSEKGNGFLSGSSLSTYQSSDDFDEAIETGSSNNQVDLNSDDDDDDNLHQREEPLGRSVNMLQGCRSAFEFEKLNKINEGTYGIVYRARDKKTGEIVALKKVKMGMEREGFPISALREINILLSLNHLSIVDVKEVVMDDHDNVFMVMEHMEHDLKGLIGAMKQPFSISEVKCLMLQLLEGVKYLHDNWVIHRDLKTSNLLFNNRGELKICDFGMSRQYGSPLKPYTELVVTLWYRAPEILLGTKQYSAAVDMWSVGCIMAELLTKEPLFQGKTEIDQLDKIYRLLGTPNETIWPGLSKLPGLKPVVNQRYNLLRKKFPAASFTGSPVLSDKGFDLLSRLLTYDPEKRITAEEALSHDWFEEIPLPKSKDFMPTFPVSHSRGR